MTDQRFLPHYRLRRPADFRRIYARRRSASDGRLVVYADRNDLPHPRIGLSVSSRLGGAVVRNRWKRLLREAFRLRRPELPCGYDFVVVPRGGGEPQLKWIADALMRLARKAADKCGASGGGREPGTGDRGEGGAAPVNIV